MKILFLTWKDIKHSFAGWAEKVMHEYAKWLVKKWHQVTWFASWFDWCNENDNIDWINIIRKYNINTIYFNTYKWYNEYKKTNKIDLIVDEAWWIPLLSPIYEKNIPIFFFIHHIWEAEWDEKFMFPFNKIAKFVFFNIIKLYKNQKTITVSNSTKEELIQKFWFKSENIKVIENACDIIPITEIDFNKKQNSILFLGRLMPIKRVEHAILAFNDFILSNEKFKNYTLEIIWNNQDKKYLKTLINLVQKLWIEKNIKFLWHIERKDFRDFMLKQKLILVPSIKEWFWLIVLEANSYWIPAIWYDVAWLRDSIKDWINGSLIVDWDYKKIWEKMTELLSNIDLYKEMSIKSLEYVKTLDNWEKKVDEFEEFILK